MLPREPNPIEYSEEPTMSSTYLPPSQNLDEPIEATIVERPRVPEPQTLAAAAATRSILERFVDSFFRRENIRWLAVIGAAIVVASSLMLVTREWANWPVMAKFLTILGYTGLTYLFSDWGRKHLGLQITARVLQFLTLLLLPICFLSLSWLFGPTSAIAGAAGLQMGVMIVPALALAWFASSRIFEYLWRGQQKTFLASYLLLCAAGALPRMTDAWSAIALTFVLWFVTTVGSIKINRHVFWMTEEHRLPRAFGFLPIALLGVQFLSLVAIKTAHVLPVEWMGLGLVLMSSTVLMTTQAIASVHRQRTGGSLRPLPWNILAPLVVGIAMSLFGVVVSFHGFSYGSQTTYAIVPSALLAGGLMFQVTRETNQRSFVWIGLILMAISYQCAPTLVAGFVQQVKSSAASAVGEERLPIAFYGLSYLPFLLTVAASSAVLTRRRQPAFAVPMRHFATFLALALLALSWMHLKAIFPVASVSVCLFSFYAVLFRDRRYALPAIAALTVAAGSWIPFVNAMQIADVHYFHIVTSLSVLATILTALKPLDRLINQLPQPSPAWDRDLANIFGEPNQISLRWSSALSIILVPLWAMWCLRGLLLNIADYPLQVIANPSLQDAMNNLGGLALVALLTNFALATIRTRSVYYSLAMWVMVVFSGVTTAFYMQVPIQFIANGATLAFVVVNLVTLISLRKLLSGCTLEAYSQLLSNRPERIAQRSMTAAFLLPLHTISVAALMFLIGILIIPSVLASNVMLQGLHFAVSAIAVLAWLVALKVGLRNRIAGIGAAVAFPLICSSVLLTSGLLPITHSTLPLVWTLAAVAVSIVAYRSEPQEQFSIQTASLCWVLLCAVLSLSSFEFVARVTAFVALGSLAITERFRLKRQGWTTLAIAANVQVVMVVAGLSGLSSWSVIPMHPELALSVLPKVLATLAFSAIVWDVRRLQLDEELRIAFASVLRVCFVLAAILTLAIQTPGQIDIAIMLVAFAVAVVVEFVEAMRKQHVAHVWTSFAIVASALAWLIVHQQLVIGTGVSQVALIALSGTGLLTSLAIREHHRLGFAAKPFEQLGLTCPAVVVGLTLFRTAMGVPALLPGIDSAMLLFAAAIYFYRGVANSNRGLLIAAAAIFNIALAHLWLTLGLSDSQLYLVPLGLTIIGMVELLKKEIPVAAHNTIRNIGSLVILVSPVIQILTGSWLHMVTLMLLSVLVILLAIGLRIRTLVYMGTAFLLADLVAMVIQSAVANPGMLWIGGLATGVAVIALAAYCENHREQLLSKIRILNAELATWN